MDKFYHSVRLDESLCKGCINCIKRCPTEAIRVRGGKASINNKFCIDCGECIRVCPHHAKLATYDKLDVMKKYKYTVALPAPSLYSQFNNLDDVNIVLNALLLMGFDDVFEVSAAAELVSEATRQYISEHEEQLPLISTACPSVVRLIRVRFPNLIPHLLPINPPVEVAAVLAVRKAMEDTGLPREEIGIMFISPCPSKVTYVKSPLGTEKSEIDQVLAIKDVYPKLLACMKTVVGEDYPVIGTSGKIGISWGHSGGEASGLFTENYLAADGIENVIRVLEDMEDQKFTNLRFVELNACNGGCVGGVLTVENPYVAEVKLKRLRKYMPVTHITFLIACLAIAGIPPFSGFFSKDEILTACFQFSPVMGWIMTVIAGMTAFYMFRLYYGIFWGSENKELHAHHTPHESPLTMTIPLMFLAAVTVVGGWQFVLPFGHFISSNGEAYNIHLDWAVAGTSIAIAVASIALATYMYIGAKHPLANALARRFNGLWTAAYHRFYIDEVYQFITHRIIFGCICRPIAWWDRHVVDGFFNFLAWSANTTSDEIRGLQSGRIQQYTFVFLLGTLALILLLLL